MTHSSLLYQNIIISSFFSSICNLYAFFKVQEHVSQPYKTSGKWLFYRTSWPSGPQSRIREVSDPNLCQQTGCPGWGLSWFSLPLQVNGGIVPVLGHYCFLLHPFQIIIRLSFLAASFELLTASLNNPRIYLNRSFYIHFFRKNMRHT
jgi:hypothetical protein